MVLTSKVVATIRLSWEMREMKGHTWHSTIEWATVEAVVDVCVVYAGIVNPIST